MEIPGKSMKSIHWNSMKFHKNPWKTVGYQRKSGINWHPWESLKNISKFNKNLWTCVHIYGKFAKINKNLWTSWGDQRRESIAHRRQLPEIHWKYATKNMKIHRISTKMHSKSSYHTKMHGNEWTAVGNQWKSDAHRRKFLEIDRTSIEKTTENHGRLRKCIKIIENLLKSTKTLGKSLWRIDERP